MTDPANTRPDRPAHGPIAPEPLVRVVNATGVVNNTNLGRAPIDAEVARRMAEAAETYSNLEWNLAKGRRTRRHLEVGRLLAETSGAEAGFAVNNNAAAVLLCVATLAGAGGAVVVSRGELVEIGASCRLHEIIEAGGARLCVVGATNSTRLDDYEQSLDDGGDRPTVLMKVHASNFHFEGEFRETTLPELVELAQRRGVPLVHDVGSGLLRRDPDPEGAWARATAREPCVAESIAEGADLVTFSGDKLLGGPQAGCIVGRRDLVERISRHVLARTVRVEKVTLAGLQALLEAPEGRNGVRRLIEIPPSALEARAREVASALADAAPRYRTEVLPSRGSIGGGATPGESVPSFAVAVEMPGTEPSALDAAFRRGRPPVVGTFLRGRYVLDVLALLEGDVVRIAKCARAAAGTGFATETARKRG